MDLRSKGSCHEHQDREIEGPPERRPTNPPQYKGVAVNRPFTLHELQGIWAERDALYGTGAEDWRGEAEVAAIRQGRIREVNFLAVPERAAGWAAVTTWVPPFPIGEPEINELSAWL